jgi:hypothetical protein
VRTIFVFSFAGEGWGEGFLHEDLFPRMGEFREERTAFRERTQKLRRIPLRHQQASLGWTRVVHSRVAGCVRGVHEVELLGMRATR